MKSSTGHVEEYIGTVAERPYRIFADF